MRERGLVDGRTRHPWCCKATWDVPCVFETCASSEGAPKLHAWKIKRRERGIRGRAGGQAGGRGGRLRRLRLLVSSVFCFVFSGGGPTGARGGSSRPRGGVLSDVWSSRPPPPRRAPRAGPRHPSWRRQHAGRKQKKERGKKTTTLAQTVKNSHSRSPPCPEGKERPIRRPACSSVGLSCVCEWGGGGGGRLGERARPAGRGGKKKERQTPSAPERRRRPEKTRAAAAGRNAPPPPPPPPLPCFSKPVHLDQVLLDELLRRQKVDHILALVPLQLDHLPELGVVDDRAVAAEL